jgi:hypothetical protein
MSQPIKVELSGPVLLILFLISLGSCMGPTASDVRGISKELERIRQTLERQYQPK